MKNARIAKNGIGSQFGKKKVKGKFSQVNKYP